LIDNGSIYKGKKVEKAIKNSGAKLIYLSPSSPDFSPIDNLWSKLKIILRSLNTRNYQELGKAIELEIFTRYQALPGNEKKKR